MSQGEEYLQVVSLDDRPGLRIVDRIERKRYALETSKPVSPTPADPEECPFPVSKAVRIATEELTLQRVVGVYVRDESQSMLTAVEHQESASLPAGTYTLELATQIKTYLQVEGPVEISSDVERTRIEFPATTDVLVGIRSRHERPAATVTTTDDPLDVMQAIETFGSALKTADPERSYPTLRGHPPAVELGDRLDIPEGLDRPDTGVRLELPPTHAALYVAAPLAYYLGAELVPGEVPLLTTDTGFEYAFDRQSFEADVERVLKQVFFLDCVTRTEGLYDLNLHERTAVEPQLDLDFETLYDQPLAEQVATYLSVPYSTIEEHVPQWRLTAHVEPDPESVEQIPFLVDDLAVVRTVRDVETGESAEPHTTRTFAREEKISGVRGDGVTGKRAYVNPGESDSLEQAWVGDSIPIGASKLVTAAFRNRLDRETVDGDIAIAVVLNDGRMDEEQDVVDQAYGDRDDLPFDVSFHRDPTVTELRDVMRERTDFLHYIGHTEADGLECTDGKLDVGTLDETGVDSFLLNSCNSYDQGLRLIETGAIGGVVTLSDISNREAVHVGELTARLLNAGFPLRAALTIAREESVLGEQYIVVGDGGLTVTQPPGRTPNLMELNTSDDVFALTYRTFVTDIAGLGSVVTPYIERVDQSFLSSGDIATFELSKSELRQFLDLEQVPVRIDGDLHWSQSVDLAEIL